MSSTSLELDRDLLNYIQRVTLREPDVLRRLREQTARMPMGRMQVSPEQGQLMGLLIRLMGAKRTIEVGVFTGYSSISVAMALPPGGRLIACDVSEEWTSVARDYWREAGVDTRIELRLRPALQTLDSLLAEGSAGSFDFAFIDADKESYSGYYERCLKLVRPGGLIAVDNVLWHGDVLDPSKQDEDTRAIRAFNQQLHEDQRVWISLLPVGDGLTLALKK
ncbi:MAG TPA: class I SAM-dependent methyltransferase [Bryobacteraceae bacterium]|nr:class I SAM-dependent methyltransferase [Bryobacteraceae bacterium]